MCGGGRAWWGHAWQRWVRGGGGGAWWGVGIEPGPLIISDSKSNTILSGLS